MEAKGSKTGDGTGMPHDRADSRPLAPGPSTDTTWSAQQPLVRIRVLPVPEQSPSARVSGGRGEAGEQRGVGSRGGRVEGEQAAQCSQEETAPELGAGDKLLSSLGSRTLGFKKEVSECHLVLTPTHS